MPDIHYYAGTVINYTVSKTQLILLFEIAHVYVLRLLSIISFNLLSMSLLAASSASIFLDEIKLKRSDISTAKADIITKEEQIVRIREQITCKEKEITCKEEQIVRIKE
jgi:hypothetical protein